MIALRIFILTLAGLALAGGAQATWIDDDPVCQNFGCVVVHDGTNAQVYDAVDSLTGRRLGSGEQLILRATNPVIGSDYVAPVVTGTQTSTLISAPMQDQGIRLGIDRNRDGVADFGPDDTNGSGFLDAGDSFQEFDITGNEELVGSSTSYQRSFYMTSTVGFHITAEAIANLSGAPDYLQSDPRSIGFTHRIQRAGNDNGFRFGRRAQKGNQYRTLTPVSTIADLIGQPVPILDARREIAKGNASTLAEQSVRFDYVYDFAGYDMALGSGELSFDLEFNFQMR